MMGLLPLNKEKVVSALSDQIFLVYGRPKIGKSTFCSYFKDAVFLATEPGLNHLEVAKVKVDTWAKFMDVCKELKEGKHKFRTVIIDTIDNLVSYCNEYVCAREGIKHPSDYDYGKGWSMVNQELQRVLAKVAMLPYGLVMVGHSKEKEVKTKTKTYGKMGLSLSGSNSSTIVSMADIILYVDQDVKEEEAVGIMRTKPSIYYEAGDRTKRLPEMIEFPLSDPKVAFDKIKACFD